MVEISRRLFVLNPGGRDPNQDFPDGAGTPDQAGHPPINFHAYAACMKGGFRRDASLIPPGSWVVLLLRRRHLARAQREARALSARGCRVWAAWKEAGWFQIQEALQRRGAWKELCAVSNEVAGALVSTPEAAPLMQAAGFTRVVFLPTPYPLEELAWDFSLPLERRAGVFLGTRQFDTLSRSHAAALVLASRLAEPLTVIATGGRAERKRLEELAPRARVVQGPLTYPDYLRLMARHRIVFQLDRSLVPGQVAGDALLCRMPCVGGDSAIERLAYPGLCGFGRGIKELLELAARLLQDDAAWEAACQEARARANPKLSFSAARQSLLSLGEEKNAHACAPPSSA